MVCSSVLIRPVPGGRCAAPTQEHPAVQPNFLKASQHYFNDLDIRHLVLMQTDISQLPQPTTVAEFDTLQRAHMDQVSGYLHQEYIMKVVRAPSGSDQT